MSASIVYSTLPMANAVKSRMMITTIEDQQVTRQAITNFEFKSVKDITEVAVGDARTLVPKTRGRST
ncbi:MAG TPA: hypothetical protein VK436_02400 [Methanocella sp.]|nr:hypothetical protein [Methanocella sp.]